MEDRNLFQRLGQVSDGEAAEVFRSHLRDFVLKMICDVMASEVNQLCGRNTSLTALSGFVPEAVQFVC